VLKHRDLNILRIQDPESNKKDPGTGPGPVNPFARRQHDVGGALIRHRHTSSGCSSLNLTPHASVLAHTRMRRMPRAAVLGGADMECDQTATKGWLLTASAKP
jgi:hypothetical protein